MPENKTGRKNAESDQDLRSEVAALASQLGLAASTGEDAGFDDTDFRPPKKGGRRDQKCSKQLCTPTAHCTQDNTQGSQSWGRCNRPPKTWGAGHRRRRPEKGIRTYMESRGLGQGQVCTSHTSQPMGPLRVLAQVTFFLDRNRAKEGVWWLA